MTLLLFLSCLLAGAAPGARATPVAALRRPLEVVFSSDRGAFEARVGGLCNQEDFEASTTDSLALHGASLWACTEDEAIAPGDIEGGLAVKAPAPDGSPVGGVVATYTAGFFGQPSVVAGASDPRVATLLEFYNDPEAVGFELRSLVADSVTVRVFDPAGRALGSTVVSAGPGFDQFVGVEVDSGAGPIGRIAIESASGTWESVDDVVFSGACQPVLGLSARRVVPGEPVRIGVSEAASAALGILFLRTIDGVPFSRVLSPVLSVPGTLCLGPFDVPPTPAVAVGLEMFVLDPASGQLASTNRTTLFID